MGGARFEMQAAAVVPSGAKHLKMSSLLPSMPNWYRPAARQSLGARRDHRRAPSGSAACTSSSTVAAARIPPGQHFFCTRPGVFKCLRVKFSGVVKMKEQQRRTMPLHLTLDNFDCVEAKDSPYVLTSPRSLEACKILGIKPIELLYQSLAEVRQKLGGESASLDKVITVYQNQEKERRSKLEACKAVRDHLSLSTTADLKENQNPSPKSRKDLVERENNNVARHDKALRSLENTSEETTGGDSSLKSPSPSKSPPLKVHTPIVKKSPILSRSSSVPRKTPSPFFRKSPSPILKHSPASSSRKSSPTQIPAPSFRVTASPRRRLANNRVRPRTVPNIKVSPKSPPLRKSPGSLSLQNKNFLRVTRFSPDCGRPKSSTSYSSSFSSSKASPSSATATIPEHDRRILDSMVLKREHEIAAQQLAFEVHRAWEESKEEQLKEKEKQTQLWREHLIEKRRMENEMNERKMAMLLKEEHEAKQKLQQTLSDKELRAAAVLQAASSSKYHNQGAKADLIEQQRAAVACARVQIQLQKAAWRQSVERRIDDKMRRAEQTRARSADSVRRRVQSANRVDEMKRAERKKALEMESREALAALRAKCEAKQKRAEWRLSTIAIDKERSLKGQSEARSGKLETARKMHAELEEGLKQWRLHCMQLQAKAAEEAAKRATQQYLEKKRKAEQANKSKEEHHTLVMSRISAGQNALLEARRSAVLAKEDKMRRLQKMRENAVIESRSTAHSTALLRDSVRRTLTPETFDKLVARTALETRVTASRTSTISSLPTSTSKSHILLG